jgi:hypothetical protein
MFIRNSTHAIAVLAILSLIACSTLETAADHARDFAGRHPIVTTVATVAVVAGAYTLAHSGHRDVDAVRRPVEPYPCARHPDLCN